jgi:hypothetical protein
VIHTRHRSGSALAVWDLGTAEPDWSQLKEGSSSSKAIEITDNSTTQVWGTVFPGETAVKPLCKWRESSRNNGAGDCRTDVSWLHSAVGIDKTFFDDALANYILRFHMQGACYRSSQVQVYRTERHASYLMLQNWCTKAFHRLRKFPMPHLYRGQRQQLALLQALPR